MKALTPEEVLTLVPQQKPMRFIERILELDGEHILGTYTWSREDCRGASPEERMVPNFKLVEMAAQIGSVAWCIYHMSLTMSPSEIEQLVGYFTQIEDASFPHQVRAGETVACQAVFGDEGYFRNSKILSRVEIQILGGPRDGLEAFSGLVSGMWLPKTASNPGSKTP